MWHSLCLGWRAGCSLGLLKPLCLCSLPAQHSLGPWPLSEVASHLKRMRRATGLSVLEFLVFVIVFFQIKFQKSGFKNNREIQSSPPSCLAETNPQQRPMCSLASHLLIFRCQLSSVLGGEEKDSLGSKDKGPGGRAQARPDAWLVHALVGRQLLETAVKSGFPWRPSLLVPSPGLGRRSKQLWKTVSTSDPEFILLPWGDIGFCSRLPFPIMT